MNNDDNRINGRIYVHGEVQNEKTLEYYRDMSPTSIVLNLAQPFSIR